VVIMNEYIVIIALLAGLVSIQYWRGRRLNLGFIRAISNELEKTLNPLEHSYTWIGAYAGITAEYRIKNKNINSIDMSLTLLPRHSLLYFPVSLIIGRRDRIALLIKMNNILKERMEFKTGRNVKESENSKVLDKDIIVINNVKIHRWYSDKSLADKYTQIFKKLEKPENVRHYAKLKITDGTPHLFLKEFMEI